MLYDSLLSLPRWAKRLFFMGMDLALVPLCLTISLVAHSNGKSLTDLGQILLPLYVGVTAAGAIIIFFLGLNRVKLRAFENSSIIRTAVGAVCIALTFALLCKIFEVPHMKSEAVSLGVFFFVISIAARICGQFILSFLSDYQTSRKRVLIFGAGQAGIQLVAALRQGQEARPIAFVDDSVSLVGQIVAGLPVLEPKNMKELVHKRRIDRILLATPSVSEARRSEILRRIENLGCDVQSLPSFVELMNGKGLVESLRPVSADQLLGRDKVDLNVQGIETSYANKVVMVTGAGGSIGSELCRQLVNCGIRQIIFYEHSEYALYKIHKELEPMFMRNEITVEPVLGSVTDKLRVEGVIEKFGVQIILHAAAYKHVPLVEANELEGLRNNVLGTKTVADAAKNCNIERFILVSTDKAVRPTNIMGASKRLAELTVQDLASRSNTTLFSMVRFGNVLGSSGSVIPLFKEQIERGGPVTVTHDDVTRYFMTIPEAARLVLLAGSFARGGDVFVLDMGDPVKIKDLARSMVELSGRTVRDDTNPEGDIEIKISGLRPGEKLFEELLIGNDMLTTPHPKILRAQEDRLSEIEVAGIMKDISVALSEGDSLKARVIVERWVEGYEKPASSSA